MHNKYSPLFCFVPVELNQIGTHGFSIKFFIFKCNRWTNILHYIYEGYKALEPKEGRKYGI